MNVRYAEVPSAVRSRVRREEMRKIEGKGGISDGFHPAKELQAEDSEVGWKTRVTKM